MQFTSQDYIQEGHAVAVQKVIHSFHVNKHFTQLHTVGRKVARGNSFCLRVVEISLVKIERALRKREIQKIYFSLEGHSLSHKLSWLLSDKEHLLSCLEPWAFLCQENLAEATLLCLRVVERNQPVLLAEIDPCLVSRIRNFAI